MLRFGWHIVAAAICMIGCLLPVRASACPGRKLPSITRHGDMMVFLVTASLLDSRTKKIRSRQVSRGSSTWCLSTITC
jgi:hypothetical protein